MHSKSWGLVLALLLPGAAWATNVIGNLNADTRWTKAGSPYRLLGDVTVAPGATLTIEPGVVVQASTADELGAGRNPGRVELTIRGALVANGTAEEPIVFRTALGTTSGWYGIVFEEEARPSSLTRARITAAIYGIHGRAPASAFTVSDLSISEVESGVLWASAALPTLERVSVFNGVDKGFDLADDGASGATATVRDCVVHAMGSEGVLLRARVNAAISGTTIRQTAQGIVVSPSARATVERSRLLLNYDGIYAPAGSELTATNNVIAGSYINGLSLEQSGTRPFHILNNTIDRSRANPLSNTGGGTGVEIRAVTSAPAFILRNNIVTHSGTTGIRVLGSTAPSADHNNVWNNGTNYSGMVPGVGSVSVNPLYEQPLGPLVWTFVSSPFSIQNPGHNFTREWTFNQPGALRMRAIITSMNTEACCDRLRIYDSRANMVDDFSGTRTGSSQPVVDSFLRAAFTTNSTVLSSGFSASGYEWADITAYSYRLSASSPVLDLGNSLGAPAEDADGTPRPYDGDLDGTPGVDLGAYEFHANLPPLAVGADDRLVLPNTQVSFDASRSRDPDGTLASYDWDFGDGTAHATTATAQHTYTATGSYTVRLTVTDAQGATGTDVATITVASNLPPTARAGQDQYVAPGAAVTFDAAGSTDTDGSIIAYSWDFGDGTPRVSSPTATHSYTREGIFTATLTVTDNRGATATDTATVVVRSATPNLPPTARAGGSRTVALGEALSFDGSGSTDSDGAIVSYSWRFGDGTTATGRTASHTYAAAGIYLVVLTVEDNGGARDEDSLVVTVNGPQVPGNQAPVAEAGASRTVALGQPVALDGSGSTDSDGAIASYTWSFGDGTTASGRTASHTYAAAGTYLVVLTVEDDDGAHDEDSLVVTVSAPPPPQNQVPVAEAGASRTVALGQAVELDGSASTDADGSIASYTWSFGDGTTVTGRTASHTYAAAGTYLVVLTVEDDDGARDEDSLVVTVSAPQPPRNAAPVAEAGASRTVTLGQAVDLDGSASTDSDGVIVSYTWSFGDGTTASGRTASHTYAAAGTYLVVLTVEDDDGARDEDSLVVTVNGPQVPGNQAPVAEAGPTRTVALGQPVELDGSGSTDPDGSIASYAWDFGDGTTASGRTASHTYAAAGSYVVTLTVTDDRGATGRDLSLVVVEAPRNARPVAEAGGPYSALLGAAVTLDGSASRDSDGDLASYAWDFGDGAVSSAVRPSHTYATAGTYLVRLTVTDSQGAMAEDTALVTISEPRNTPPVARAGGNRAASVSQSLRFDASASSDADGLVASYTWDFGDGSTASGATADHAYAAAGTYLVRLTITDDKGAIGQDAAIVTVGASAANRAPVADAGNALSVEVGASVQLDASGSFDTDGTLATFAWDFGDGQTGTGAQVQHTFARAGSFLVRLTVTDDRGASAEDFVLVSVSAAARANAAPVARAGQDASGHSGQALTFSAAASADPDGSLIAWQWDFGDGATASGVSASHTYQAGGSYTVTLTVIDEAGARATDTLQVQVNALPQPDAGAARTAEVDQALSFDGSGSRDADGTVAAYAWDFGDGARADGARVSHAYGQPGVYTVRLTVTDDKGATSRAEALVVITRPAPVPPPANDGGCAAAPGSSGSSLAFVALALALGFVARRRRA